MPRVAPPPWLDGLELVRVRVPLREPFVASHGRELDRDVVLVRATGEGRTGWGECSTLSAPTYTAEHTAAAWPYLRDEAGPRTMAARGAEVEPDATHPMAWCAIDTALADLAGDWPFDGEAARRAVPSTCVVGAQPSVEATVEHARRAAAAGYRMVKLKVGPGADVEPVAAVRDALPELAVAADANGSYGSADLRSLTALDELGLAYLEQPFPAADLERHAAARQHLATSLALDESVLSLADLERAIALGALDIVNVKPARLGGLRAAHELARSAVEAGLQVFVGGMLETGVGRSAALALAAQPCFTLPTDLGPSDRYFVDDITAPVELVGGEVVLPAIPGVLVPRPDRLDAVVVDRWSVPVSA